MADGAGVVEIASKAALVMAMRIKPASPDSPCPGPPRRTVAEYKAESRQQRLIGSAYGSSSVRPGRKVRSPLKVANDFGNEASRRPASVRSFASGLPHQIVVHPLEHPTRDVLVGTSPDDQTQCH